VLQADVPSPFDVFSGGLKFLPDDGKEEFGLLRQLAGRDELQVVELEVGNLAPPPPGSLAILTSG